MMTRDIVTADRRLSELVEARPELLGTLTRFGMSLGFGDKTVREVCEGDSVDTESFLAVCSLLGGEEAVQYKVALPSLMKYLRNAHVHFLEFVLPSIRRELIEATSREDVNDVTFLLLKFFDDYVMEVTSHMNHENEEVFSYADALLRGDTASSFRITDYSATHESMTDKLNALKDIFIRHYHVRGNELLTSALMKIIECGKELEQHCEIENRLFIPAVERLERSLKIKERKEENSCAVAMCEKSNVAALTDREKEIVRCVAKGLSNKEIASRLYISIHTVTTYRRNIASKLEIHSAAGLTVFAILNRLIDIREAN